MDHLIDDLFLYSKLDLNGSPFDFEKIDLNTYFLDFIEELQFDLDKEGVSIFYYAEPAASYIVKA
ncbi:hypothetical protein [Metabacillus arenae]|uniref:hypothetical protein n=1 Tax=Metabacillus arenae TaxID=2771434 RepID=UPI001CD191CB|nr:hypothetical protein [Metabacillus arenae]